MEVIQQRVLRGILLSAQEQDDYTPDVHGLYVSLEHAIILSWDLTLYQC